MLRDLAIWNLKQLSAERFHQIADLPWLRVTYEEFVSEPHRVLESIVNLTGEPLTKFPFLNGNTVSLKGGHTAIGNRIRFDTGNKELRLDSEWKSKSSRPGLLTATLLTKPFLRRYGYEKK